MKVICISGKAESGKDSTGDILAGNLSDRGKSVLVTHFADLLKYICKEYFDWNGDKDEFGRSLLQDVGSEIRKRNEDYWVEFISFILKSFSNKWEYVIIPDCRYPNEVSVLKKNEFNVMHVRVDRPNHESSLTEEQKMHISETAMDDVKPDIVISNDGTLINLRDTVRTFIKEVLHEG